MAQRGGKRPGAGRKSKAKELGLAKLIDECVTGAEQQKLIRQIYLKAKGGDYNFTRLFMEYKFGKPTDTVDMNLQGMLEGGIKVDFTPASKPKEE